MSNDFEKQLDIHIRARCTLIALVTLEEERVIQALKTVCELNNRPCIAWDIADGFTTISGKLVINNQAKDPLLALDHVMKENCDGVIYVLKDFHEFWTNPHVKRKLRSSAQHLKFTKTSLIITTPVNKIPIELMDEVVIIRFPLPTSEEVESVLGQLIKTPGVKVNLTPLGREKIVQAALGMSSKQVQNTFSKVMVAGGTLDDRDIVTVVGEKKQIVNQSGSLEFCNHTELPDNVGGLGILKDWLKLREKAFSKEAREYGLPAPKGIALIGIPGTGKSLTAKMIGGIWQIPLLRLDSGALFGSLVGESEERTRRALEIAETVAPCVLWIDEIEKAFSFGYGDAGTSQRVFASLLTWMQDKSAPVFVVATANNIEALPPELLRRGRFDEIFFLDLPTQEERKEILTVHLKKRGRISQQFNIDKLIIDSNGYVGSEIEQAIIDALYVAFNEGRREITTEDVSLCLKRQVPLSISQREAIGTLRQWLSEGRAQSASFNEKTDAEKQFVGIPLEFANEKINP